MTDALKLAEEALEPFELFGKYLADHPRSGVGDALYGWDNSEQATLRQSDLKRAMAAASAIRAARAEWDWRPIAEFTESQFDIGDYVGTWANGRWITREIEFGQRDKYRWVDFGFTHFCRPQLPPPPARKEASDE